MPATLQKHAKGKLPVQIALGNAEGSSCAKAICEAQGRNHAADQRLDAHDNLPTVTGDTKPRWMGSTGSKQVTWEQVASADPDVLIICGCGLDLERNTRDSLPTLRDHPVASRLRAVREGRVFAMDGNRTLSRPGPSLVEGAAAVAACLWYDESVRRAALERTGCVPQEGEVWAKLNLEAELQLQASI